MLLTKLIPPKSTELKNAVSDFNRFIEEPNSDPTERLILTLAGGRGCCKSSIASGLVLKGCQETGQSAVCLRKRKADIRDTIGLQITNTMDLFKLSLSPQTYVAGDDEVVTFGNGGCFLFGIDKDLETLRNSKRNHLSNVRFVWIDEADELTGMDELQYVLSAIPLSPNPVIILTFNPPASRDHWINNQVWGGESRLINGINHVMRFYHPTFLDVPREWLGNKFFEDAEVLQRINEEAYRHVYLGWPNGSPTH